MASNKFLALATGSSATVLSDADYAALTAVLSGNGFQAGVFPPEQFNKVAKQTTIWSAVLGQLIVDQLGIDATDGQTVATLKANFQDALSAIIGSYGGAVHVGTSTGTTDALAATVTPPVSVYSNGAIFLITPNLANTTTTPTLNVNSLGAKTIVHPNGTPLTAGEITTGSKILLAYDSTLDQIVLLAPTFPWLASQFVKASALATVAQILAATSGKILAADTIWSAAAPVPLAYASTINIDLSTGVFFSVTLTGNAAFTFSNAKPGQQFEVDIIQDATGSRTASWPTGIKWPTSTAPALSTAAGTVDRLVGKCVSADVVRAQLGKGWAA